MNPLKDGGVKHVQSAVASYVLIRNRKVRKVGLKQNISEPPTDMWAKREKESPFEQGRWVPREGRGPREGRDRGCGQGFVPKWISGVRPSFPPPHFHAYFTSRALGDGGQQAGTGGPERAQGAAWGLPLSALSSPTSCTPSSLRPLSPPAGSPPCQHWMIRGRTTPDWTSRVCLCPSLGGLTPTCVCVGGCPQ